LRLPGCFLAFDHTDWADGHAGPAAGAGILDKRGHEGAAAAGAKPDRLGRAGIAAGLAINIAEGETALADRHDMIEALRGGGGKHRLRTGLRAFAAKGTFPAGKIHRRQTAHHGNDAAGTGFDTFCTTATSGEVAQRDPGGTDAWSMFLTAAQQIAPAERGFHHHGALNDWAAPEGRK